MFARSILSAAPAAPAATGRIGLQWLLGGMSPEEFDREHWGRSRLRLARGDASFYAALANTKDYEQAIALACSVAGAAEELLEGERSTPCRSHRAALTAIAAGRSLRVNAIQRFLPPLAIFCRSLEHDLGCPVSTNLYLTPPDGRALPRHFDTHDVFVLQICGNKRWRLFDTPVEAPAEYVPALHCERPGRARARRRRFAHSFETSEPQGIALMDEFLLQQGDFLYLPRGVRHQVVGVPDSFSLHLTIGAQSFTYIDLLTALIGAAAETQGQFRQSLPVGLNTREEVSASVIAHARGLLARMAKGHAIPAAVESLAAALEENRPPVTGGVIAALLRKQSAGVSARTPLRVRPGLVWRMTRAPDSISAVFDNVSLTVPRTLESALLYIHQSGSFRAADLPGVAEGDKLAFALRLITDGLVEPCENL